jgi:hypothetical protein
MGFREATEVDLENIISADIEMAIKGRSPRNIGMLARPV